MRMKLGMSMTQVVRLCRHGLLMTHASQDEPRLNVLVVSKICPNA